MNSQIKIKGKIGRKTEKEIKKARQREESQTPHTKGIGKNET